LEKLRTSPSSLCHPGPKSWTDAALAKWSAIALQKLALKEARVVETSAHSAKGKDPEPKSNPSGANATMRYASSHAVFERLAMIVRNELLPTSAWFGAAEAAINTIYSIAEAPDAVLEAIVQQMAKPLFPDQFRSVVATELKISADIPDNAPGDDDGAIFTGLIANNEF